MPEFTDTVCAVATPPGVGALAVVRVSGPHTLAAVQPLFRSKKLTEQPSHTLHVGLLREPAGAVIDQVVLSLYRGPGSYTREDLIEISCHGSDFIVQRLLALLVQQGCRLAGPGEFTQRAFLNGQLDLAQAEAVADLIAAENAQAHAVAMSQLRGGFSGDLRQLREQLIGFASLVELELDFGEEDVAFADRASLQTLIAGIRGHLAPLISSFEYGQALKSGVPVVIAGRPNAGKSTLLNALLNEERAIVSDIPGTTRDVIEDVLVLEGVAFRFLDTAGLRQTDDRIEGIGIARTRAALKRARVVLALFETPADRLALLEEFSVHAPDKQVLWVKTKADLAEQAPSPAALAEAEALQLSALTGQGLPELRERLLALVRPMQGGTVVTSLRHYQQLRLTDEALARVLDGLQGGLSPDWLAADIRQALHHLGEITGTITTDDLLATIFSKFCIGK